MPLVHADSKENDTNGLTYKAETVSRSSEPNVRWPKGNVGGRDNLGVWH